MKITFFSKKKKKKPIFFFLNYLDLYGLILQPHLSVVSQKWIKSFMSIYFFSNLSLLISFTVWFYIEILMMYLVIEYLMGY